jgi:hypothetical protein
MQRAQRNFTADGQDDVGREKLQNPNAKHQRSSRNQAPNCSCSWVKVCAESFCGRCSRGSPPCGRKWWWIFCECNLGLRSGTRFTPAFISRAFSPLIEGECRAASVPGVLLSRGFHELPVAGFVMIRIVACVVGVAVIAVAVGPVILLGGGMLRGAVVRIVDGVHAAEVIVKVIG